MNTKPKKPTLATLKSFVNKNRAALLVKCNSSFDGMVDMVMPNHDAAWTPAEKTGIDAAHTLGIAGVWLVGSSRDRIQPFTWNGLTGYEVNNCCGSFQVAVKLKG